MYYDDLMHIKHSDSVTLPASQSNVILNNLMSYTLYNISIAGLTNAGEGWNRTSVLVRSDVGGMQIYFLRIHLTHVKISHLVTTCYQAVNKMCSHCLFPVVDKLLSICSKVDDGNRLATSLLQQV